MELEELVLDKDTAFDQELVEEQEFLHLDDHLSQLMSATLALETYGVNPAALELLQKTDLLSSTAHQAIAMESHFTPRPSEDQAKMAMEAMTEKIKETSVRWAAKILSVAKRCASTMLAVLTPLYNKVAELTKRLATKTWDATKAAGRTIAAHPYKTIFAVVGAITAVAAIMAYCGSSFPGGHTTRDALAGFFAKVNEQINKIPWPFGKVESVVSETNNFRIDRVFPPKAAAAPIEELGWTASTVKTLGAQLDKSWDATKRGINVLGIRMLKITSDIGHATFGKAQHLRKAAPQFAYNMTGSSEFAHATAFAVGGIYYGACISLVYAIYRLVKKIIVGGFRLIFSTLGSLLHL